MAIPDEDVAKVRAATDIAGLIGEHTSLKRVGQRLVGLCPFHSEKSPSFSVNAEEGLYYCFGCQASGDAISFVRAIEGSDFVDAVERLAARAGVSIRNDADPSDGANRTRRNQLHEALEAAVAFYTDLLLNDPRAKGARQYLRSRGYDGETVRQFQIGFAPPGYDALVRAVRFPSAVMVEAGLAFENRSGRLQDAFRERILFPIFDPGGKAIALGGRVLPEELRSGGPEAGPKYRNSPESPIYQKRATLYGLNWAKGEIARSREAIICEGYTDVIGFFKADIPRAVATCGTVLTEDHFRLLARFATRIVCCFDADNAGQNAAARLYEWERRHELELAVAEFPNGADPADLARTDPEALRAAVEHARPFLGFRVERALAHHDLSSPEGRTRAAETAIAAIAEHPTLARDQYVLTVADRTRHEPAELRTLLEQARVALATEERRAPVQGSRDYDEPPSRDEPGFADDEEGSPVGPASRRAARDDTQELRAGRDALVLAIHRPEDAAPWFDDLFTNPDQREAFRVLSASAELHEAIAKASAPVAELIRRLATSTDAEDLDAEGTFLVLVRLAAIRTLRSLDADARRAADSGDTEAIAYNSTRSAWVRGELEHLQDFVVVPGRHSEAIEASRRLVAWIGQGDQEG